MKDAAWYDTAMTDPDGPAMLPLEDSPWLHLYEEVARWIPPHEHVVDLGCGTGRFIQQLYENKHYAPIVGVDWSQAALLEAISYCRPVHGQATMPLFELEDLDEWTPEGERNGNTVYVCTEVLEHIELDLDLIRKIPAGHRFVFSLPNYWSESHERWFDGPGSIWERYAGLLEFTRWSLVEIHHPIKHIHVLDTRRRSDSW